MDSFKVHSPPTSRRRLRRRSASSPPSPGPFMFHASEKSSTPPTLEDSVKFLSLNARRRLLKRPSGSAIPQMPSGKIASLSQEKVSRRPPTHEPAFHAESPQPHFRTPSSTKCHASFTTPPEAPPPSPHKTAPNTAAYPFPQSNPWSIDPSQSRTSPGQDSVCEYAPDEHSDSSSSLPSTSSRDLFSSSSALCSSSSGSPRDLMFPNHMTWSKSAGPVEVNAHFQNQQAFQKQPAPQEHTLSGLSLPVFPFSRPHSLPGAHSSTSGAMHLPSSANPDRISSASLSQPTPTPYFTLPTLLGSTLEENKEWKQDNLSVADPTTSLSVYDHVSSPSSSDSNPVSLKIHQSSPPARTNTYTSSIAFPPPAPPTILTPAPPPTLDPNGNERLRAPYESFLNRAPPPDDCWIAVETSQSEYVSVVRLPGFKRDGITLAMRRRRILHIVADSWEPGGGHFERRISFGYDADLTQVRAEFDGEHLRVFVPRRPTPMNSWSSRQ